MNQDTLSNIVNHPEKLDANTAVDLVQLCTTFPYFPIPFILLGKHYSQKKDFRTDGTIFQAALRVQNREWLFQFINSNSISISSETKNSLEVQSQEVLSSHSTDNNFFEQINQISHTEKPETDIEIENQDTQIEIPDEVKNPEPLVEFNTEIESFLFLPSENTENSVENDIEISSTNRSWLFDPEVEVKPAQPEQPEPKDTIKPHYTIGYNLEDYYSVPSEPVSKNPSNTETDFFSWLNSDNKNQGPINKPEGTKKDTLIEKFIKENPSISRPKQEFFSPERAMKKSEVLDLTIATETLANIYLKQGYPEKAIKVYKQLELKFPEKLSYFATLIEKIKEEHNL